MRHEPQPEPIDPPERETPRAHHGLASTCCALLLAAACAGGQSGDPGTGFEDQTTLESTAAPHCEGELAHDDDAGVDEADIALCDAVDAGGFDCTCGERSGTSDAMTCIDALRERCGAEPAPLEADPCVEVETEGPGCAPPQDPDGP